MNMKYSFIIPYFKRPQYLRATLMSYRHFYGTRTDWEVILIEDGANADDAIEHSILLKLIEEFQPVTVLLTAKDRNQINPARLRNLAARIANGKYLVQTNPEVIHRSNVLNAFDSYFKDGTNQAESQYLVCACENAKCRDLERTSFEELEFTHLHWYCHSVHNNRKLHFCSVISAAQYEAIGGFDETYAQWIGYDDDDFREAVIRSGIELVTIDDVVVTHIDHPREYLPSQYDALFKAAKKYYENKWR